MMTLTRKYFEALIDSYGNLTLIANNEVVRYIALKRDLHHLIKRIQQFNLIELTFTEDFLRALETEVIDDIANEKRALINELHFELYTCLNVRRLRYGGELMQYMIRLKLLLFQLPVDDLIQLNAYLKMPQDYYLHHDAGIDDETKKQAEISKLQQDLKKWPVNKDLTKIKKSYFLAVEQSLKAVVGQYQRYIFDNYPEIADEFSYCNKKVRGYLTQAMAKDAYEFRLYAYKATDGDRSTTIVQQYYDFCPSYFFNLEEIAEKQVAAMVLGLQKDHTELTGLLDVTFIHRELLEIYLRLANEAEVSMFIEFLLKLDNYYIQKEPITAGYRYDLQGRLDDHWVFFEIFHRHPRSTKIINDKIRQMLANQPNGNMTFLFTSRPEEDVIQMLADSRIQVLYLNDLFQRHFRQNNSEVIHWYIKSRLRSLKSANSSSSISFDGQKLIKRLEQCPPGELYWTEFELIGADIFKYLFEDNFRVYLSEMQSENDLKNHRRDLIVNNNHRSTGSFWSDVKDHFKCSAIIVDFKNYTQALTANTLFSVSKYNVRGVGNFAIVFSRKGLDDSAIKEQQSLFRNDKLLIDFSDEELIGMIREKMIGKDPIDRLDSKKFQLIKKVG